MPRTTRGRRGTALLAAAAGFALVATALTVPAPAGAASAAAPAAAPVAATVSATATAPVASKHSRKFRAKAALARVQKAFAADTPAGERPDATMALRDLALYKDSLSKADRKLAKALGGRPNTTAVLEDPNFVLHYTPGKVQYDVNQAFTIMQGVVNTYAAAGYRAPKSDRGKGGDNRIDIYIGKLPPGFYGFCTTDQNVKLSAKKFDVWAFCVLNQNYSKFPRTPIENFAVTAAHEYFHAVQFAYDIREDGWLLEATAAWAEDELFDSINDNFQYLARSPITQPGRSIDKFDGGGTYHYGVWNFFRFLSEKFPDKIGPMPGIMLSIIQNTDSSQGRRKNLYSTKAVDKTLKAYGTSFAEQFTLYSAATRYSHQSFSEGTELNYPIKKASGIVLPVGKKAKGKTRLDHLSSKTFNFGNGGGATALQVKVKMGKKKTGSTAVAVTYDAAGLATSVVPIALNKKGKGKVGIAFGAGDLLGRRHAGQHQHEVPPLLLAAELQHLPEPGRLLRRRPVRQRQGQHQGQGDLTTAATQDGPRTQRVRGPFASSAG